jgi:glycosyltransferase involved in cell wall biosynthesis
MCLPGVASFRLGRRGDTLERLARALDAIGPDVVHLHNGDNGPVTARCAALAPTVRSVHTHGPYCPGGAKYFPSSGVACARPYGAGCIAHGLLTHCMSRRPGEMLRSYARVAATLAADRELPATIAGSCYTRDALVANGFDPTRVVVVPYFVRPPAPPPGRPEPSVILFTGRIYPQKGLDVLLRALARVRSPWRLIVDGEGPALPSARALASTLGLVDRIEFTGWAPPAAHWRHFERASIVVVPSIWPEPFGLVGLEAMSFGRPVVAFAIGGVPDWLAHGLTGLVTPPGDERALAAALDQLLGDPDLAECLGAAGRLRAEHHFSRDVHLSEIVAIYRRACGGERRTA